MQSADEGVERGRSRRVSSETKRVARRPAVAPLLFGRPQAPHTRAHTLIPETRRSLLDPAQSRTHMIGPRTAAAPRGRASVAVAATGSSRPGRSRIARTAGRAPSPPPPRATSPAVAAASSVMAPADAGASAVEAGPVAAGGSAAAAAAAALAQLRAVEALVADLGALGAELEFELTVCWCGAWGMGEKGGLGAVLGGGALSFCPCLSLAWQPWPPLVGARPAN